MASKKKSSREYGELLRDPRWQKLRLKILERDEWTCQICFDTATTLNVHHLDYRDGAKPWEYNHTELVTLCESCHKVETKIRFDDERRLLKALRRNFFSYEMEKIAVALEARIHGISHHPVLSDAIAHALTDPNVELVLLKSYLKSLSERKELERSET